MDHLTQGFEGVFTALITPFREHAIDYAAFEALIERQLAAGVAGLVIAGTTGESATLTGAETAELIARAKQVAGTRALVMAGAGANSTAEAVEKVVRAEQAGADALLIVTPYYNKPTQAGLVAHYAATAEATGLPIMLYSVPGRCGIEIASDTCAELAGKYRNIIGIKEAGGSVARVTQIRQACGRSFIVHSGDDALTLPFLSVGAIGVTSVLSNVAPDEMVLLVDAWHKGDVRRALLLHEMIAELCEALFVESNPGPAKAALAMLGLAAAELRLPLVQMADANRSMLASAMDRLSVARAAFQEKP